MDHAPEKKSRGLWCARPKPINESSRVILRETVPTQDIHLVWVPFHVRIKGNAIDDETAGA